MFQNTGVAIYLGFRFLISIMATDGSPAQKSTLPSEAYQKVQLPFSCQETSLFLREEQWVL